MGLVSCSTPKPMQGQAGGMAILAHAEQHNIHNRDSSEQLCINFSRRLRPQFGRHAELAWFDSL